MLQAGDYLSKVYGKSISLEASATSLMLSLFSRNGKYREDVKLLPAKYRFFNVLG
jgi:leucine-rich PPR motif-containing protein